MAIRTLDERGMFAAGPRAAHASRLALLPAAALDDNAAAIRALGEAAVSPNPFLLPEFLGPAIRTLGHGRVELAVVRDGFGLSFFAPVVTGRWRSGSFPPLRFWSHPFAPLGQPLIRRKHAEDTAGSIAADLRDTASCLVIPDAPLASPAIALLVAAAEAAGGGVRMAARQRRPLLRADDPDGSEGFDRALGRKRRKEMARQLRRLGDRGAVSIETATQGRQLSAAIETFLALEASGWKGRAGSAMAQDPVMRDFAVSAIEGLAAHGHAAVDIMRAGGRPVAAMVRLEAGGLAIPWKIAFEEAFSASSPGAQLMASASRRWFDDPAIARVDPVCAEDNPLLRHMWRDSEPYATLYLEFGLTGFRAAAGAAAEDARRALKTLARRMVSGDLSRRRSR